MMSPLLRATPSQEDRAWASPGHTCIPCEKDIGMSFSPQDALATSVHMQMHPGSVGIVRAVQRAANDRASLDESKETP